MPPLIASAACVLQSGIVRITMFSICATLLGLSLR